MIKTLTNLPIYPSLQAIVEALASQDVLILQAEPGAGKSTAVPVYLLEHLALQDKKIVMLEPRRIAAKSLAQYLARLLGEEVGQTVGYQIRNERKITANTRLEIITEGLLTQRIQSDPELKETGLVIFDEFHERSIHADLGLTLCRDIREAYNESLKVLVMSATMDTKAVSEFLHQAPVIESEGRCYPVATEYLSQPIKSSHSRDWLAELNKLVIKAVKATDGDVLVFLPGQGEIKRSLTALSETFLSQSVVVKPLYGGLKLSEQQAALQVDEQGRQKVVLATNIAETSLTIANISAVVDCGLERVAHYDVSSGMTRLLTQRISLASAEQRMGRAGRVQTGHCYRLWTESQHLALEPFAKQEIITSDLSALQLSLVQWGVKDYTDLAWLTPPPPAHIDTAVNLLIRLGLITDNRLLTAKGKQATKLTIEPRYAALIVALKDRDHKVQSMACDVVAVLTDSHFYQDQNDIDIVSRLLALQAYRENRQQAKQQYPIQPAIAEQALQTAKRISRFFDNISLIKHTLTELQQTLGQLVAMAFPDRVAKLRSAANNQGQTQVKRYLLANGKGAFIPDYCAMQASEWLAIADLDGQRGEARIFLACEITQQSIEDVFGFEEIEQYRYNKNTQKITAQQQTKLGAIVLRETPVAVANPQKIQACLQQAIIESNLAILPWKKSLKAWLNRVEWLSENAPDSLPNLEHVQKINLPGLVNSVDAWLFPYIENIQSVKALQAIDLEALIKASVPYNVLSEIDKQAPLSYQTPSGKNKVIDYQLGQLPKVSVVLQEMFGELSSPKLAWGEVNLTFELLSPAQRPIQTTSDLANFWQTSYFEVAKEMRGRYPKHRWPDKPLEEKPGRSIKGFKDKK